MREEGAADFAVQITVFTFPTSPATSHSAGLPAVLWREAEETLHGFQYSPLSFFTVVFTEGGYSSSNDRDWVRARHHEVLIPGITCIWIKKISEYGKIFPVTGVKSGAPVLFYPK